MHPAEYLVLPLENTIHGVVTDTADCLLSALSSKAEPPRIVADTALRISHHLVALRGAALGSITEIRSHEQALGQSSVYLDRYLPEAKRANWESTAGALQSILEEGRAGLAAICSQAAYEAHEDRLELLCSATQGIKSEFQALKWLMSDNYTRFLLLSRRKEEVNGLGGGERTVFYACAQPSLVKALARGRTIRSVHQRPAPPATSSSSPFPRWVLLELTGMGTGDHSTAERDVVYLGSCSSEQSAISADAST